MTDFAVCPTVCSKSSLKNIIDSLLTPGQQPTVYYQPIAPPLKFKPNDSIISMNGFYKVMLSLLNHNYISISLIVLSFLLLLI